MVRIATRYGLDGPGIESRCGRDFSAPVQTSPGSHPASCTMSTGSFPGLKSGRGVTLTTHPLLMPWSRKSRAISLSTLWVIRPVQSLSACIRVHFTFYCVLEITWKQISSILTTATDSKCSATFGQAEARRVEAQTVKKHP